MKRQYRTLILIAVGLALTSPAAAQQVATIEEAAQINGGLALQLCIAPGVDGPRTAELFRQAGFSETVQRSSENSDTTHIFTAPSESARAELYYGEMPTHCIVSSNHMGVGAASSVLDQVVPRLYPGFARKIETGPVDPATGQAARCVRYEDATNPIGYVVGVAPGNGQQGCIENGTSTFFFSARV